MHLLHCAFLSLKIDLPRIKRDLVPFVENTRLSIYSAPLLGFARDGSRIPRRTGANPFVNGLIPAPRNCDRIDLMILSDTLPCPRIRLVPSERDQKIYRDIHK